MARTKLHTRTLPDGNVVTSSLNCDDDDQREIDLCKKTAFEIGRPWLPLPKSENGKAAMLLLGEDWRNGVHYSDWVSWGENMPLGACTVTRARE